MFTLRFLGDVSLAFDMTTFVQSLFLLQATVIHCATNARIEGFRLCFFRFCHDFCFWAKIPPKQVLILFVSGLHPELFTFNPYRGYVGFQNFGIFNILHHSLIGVRSFAFSSLSILNFIVSLFRPLATSQPSQLPHSVPLSLCPITSLLSHILPAFYEFLVINCIFVSCKIRCYENHKSARQIF